MTNETLEDPNYPIKRTRGSVEYFGEGLDVRGLAHWGMLVIAMAAFCVHLVAQTVPPSATPDSIIIPAGQKFILRLETDIHTRTTKKGDWVEFTTAADVVVDNQVLIPNNSQIRATVLKAKRAGRLFGRAEIQLRFDDVKMPDGTVLVLKATITRVGYDPVDSKSGENPKIRGEAGAEGDAKAVASASTQGAIIGVLRGGPRGAMYGAAAGAAITIIEMAVRRGPDVDLPRSTMFEAQFDKPMDIPAKSLLAAQKPPQPPENTVDGIPVEETQVSMISSEPVPPDETAADGEKSARRPVLKRRQPAPGEVAASEPAAHPDVVPSAPSTTVSPAEAPARAEASPSNAGAAVPTISVNVQMVQVDAVVRDRAGRMIDNLKADDFRVYEDGVLQQIQNFSRDELPLAVALVVDRSGSVAPYISELRKIAISALDQLKPKDEVCLYSFADTVDRLEDLTPDRRKIADAVDRIHAGGSTDITDALHDSVVYLSRSTPGHRHAVILISDNQQTVSPRSSETETIKTALETETVVYSLRTSGDSLLLGAQLPSVIFGRANVSKIAQETGGEVITVKQVSSLDSALGAVISRLRMRYSFGYYPSGTAQGGVFHTITVRLTERYGKAGTDYFMHARRGYYATARPDKLASFR